MKSAVQELLVSQLEYYMGGDWLGKPFGAYVQEQLQRSRFADVRELQLAAEAHVSVKLTPHGWALVRSRPAGLYEHAVLALDILGDVQDERIQLGKDISWLDQVRSYLVDTLMAEWWDKAGTLNATICLLEQIPALYPNMASSGIVKRRIGYIGKALQHHRAEAYEASVLIVLSQIDGLVRDTLKVDIFRKGQKSSDLLEGVQLSPSGVYSFEAIRTILTKDVSMTQACGDLSRHGVLHGRELDYDTKANSTKAFVALIAILEWLLAVRVEPRYAN